MLLNKWRVHYPLPLTFQGFDEDINSIALIEKLQKEIELLKYEKDNNINEISKVQNLKINYVNNNIYYN